MPPKMTANPARPARYRAGKPTGADSGSSSESESDDENATTPPKRSAPVVPTAPKRTGAGQIITSATLVQAVRESNHDAQDAERKAREAIERKAAEEGFVTASEEEDESESGDEEEDDDEDEDSEESSSDDGFPVRKIVLPKFMTRAQRERAAVDKKDEAAEEAARAEQEEKERQAEADALVEEQMRKRALAPTVRKQWEDTNEAVPTGDGEDGGEVGGGDVNTDDDVDPEAEYAAWKLRELKRIKRERERMEEKERELAEIERRRNLTEEERQAEDDIKLAAQREDKESRGKMGFMQKYYHRGAFYQAETEAEGLDKRDLMGARYVDEVRNRELLPKALQMRDMTKLGKKGASKYRDLRSEDTGRWGVLDDNRQHQQRDRYGERSSGGAAASYGGGGERDANGANAIPLGERKSYRDSDGDRRRDREWDRRDRDRSGDRRRSRSRSPRKDRRHDDYRDDRRKRSPSRDRDRHGSGDKRRRLEA